MKNKGKQKKSKAEQSQIIDPEQFGRVVAEDEVQEHTIEALATIFVGYMRTSGRNYTSFSNLFSSIAHRMAGHEYLADGYVFKDQLEVIAHMKDQLEELEDILKDSK